MFACVDFRARRRNVIVNHPMKIAMPAPREKFETASDIDG
jgi:hypothetical protein